MPHRIWFNDAAVYIDELQADGTYKQVARVELNDHVDDFRQAVELWYSRHRPPPANTPHELVEQATQPPNIIRLPRERAIDLGDGQENDADNEDQGRALRRFDLDDDTKKKPH
jgi:hypothetical protein